MSVESCRFCAETAGVGTRSAVSFASVRTVTCWRKTASTVAISTSVMRCVVQTLTENIPQKFLGEMAKFNSRTSTTLIQRGHRFN